MMGRGAVYKIIIQGGRGVLGRFSFFGCFLWRRMKARNFFQNGKILFLAKVIAFLNHKVHTIILCTQTSITIPWTKKFFHLTRILN